MKARYANKYFKIFKLILSAVICLQVVLKADVKKYDKYGIITGKKNHFRRMPYGITMKDFNEGEFVYFIKRENMANNKGTEDYWCQVANLNNNIGWVPDASLYYLDENKIPQKYFYNILKNSVIRDELFGTTIDSIKFEYLPEYNLIIFKYSERDSISGFYILKIFEIINEKPINKLPYACEYNDWLYIDKKFIFIIGYRNIDIYNRNKNDEENQYIQQSIMRVPKNNRIIRAETIMDFNKSDNCYYLKVKVRNKNTDEVNLETYKFDGKKLEYIE